MEQKSVKLYTDNNILEEFYERLHKAGSARNSQKVFDDMYLPHSDVFYVQEAIRVRTKEVVPLRAIELHMKNNGWTPKEI